MCQPCAEILSTRCCDGTTVDTIPGCDFHRSKAAEGEAVPFAMIAILLRLRWRTVWRPDFIVQEYFFTPKDPDNSEHITIDLKSLRLVPFMRACNPTLKTRTKYIHSNNCFHGTSPDIIIQSCQPDPRAIYFRRCDDRFVNALGDVLNTPQASDWHEELSRQIKLTSRKSSLLSVSQQDDAASASGDQDDQEDEEEQVVEDDQEDQERQKGADAASPLYPLPTQRIRLPKSTLGCSAEETARQAWRRRNISFLLTNPTDPDANDVTELMDEKEEDEDEQDKEEVDTATALRASDAKAEQERPKKGLLARIRRRLDMNKKKNGDKSGAASERGAEAPRTAVAAGSDNERRRRRLTKQRPNAG